MIVAIARLELRLPFAHSLKEKRRALRSLMGKVRSRFDVRLAEVGGQDRWQVAQLGFALVGSSRVQLEGIVDAVITFAEASDCGQVADVERHTVHFGDLSHMADEEEV